MSTVQVKLRFEPNSRRWFVQSDEGSWSLDHAGDVATLASYLEVLIEMPSSRPALYGKAGLRPGTETIHELILQPLHDTVEMKIIPLMPAVVSTAASEWSFGLHEDKWLECEAEVIFTDTEKVGFCFYLSERPGLLEKTVAFFADGQQISELEVDRGMIVEHWVQIPLQSRANCRLALQSSYEEPMFMSEDGRPLGVLLVSMNLDNTTWKDVVAS